MANPTCPAALSIKGEHFPCDWPTDKNGRHDGWAHGNRAAEAIWSNDAEIQRIKAEALRNAAPLCNCESDWTLLNDRADDLEAGENDD